MDLAATERQLRDRFFQAMLDATIPLQKKGTDAEVTLKAMIQAAALLKERFELELTELRQEEAE
jgi:hypothetical protein